MGWWINGVSDQWVSDQWGVGPIGAIGWNTTNSDIMRKGFLYQGPKLWASLDGRQKSSRTIKSLLV